MSLQEGTYTYTSSGYTLNAQTVTWDENSEVEGAQESDPSQFMALSNSSDQFLR